MDLLEVLSRPRAIDVLMAVGDRPGRLVRHIITEGKSPSPTLKARIDGLIEAGLVAGIPDTFRGKPVTRVELTALGTDVYRLLCVIRGMS